MCKKYNNTSVYRIKIYHIQKALSDLGVSQELYSLMKESGLNHPRIVDTFEAIGCVTLRLFQLMTQKQLKKICGDHWYLKWRMEKAQDRVPHFEVTDRVGDNRTMSLDDVEFDDNECDDDKNDCD